MKIQLDQNEIEQAIKAYINEQVTIKPGQRIDLAFTAGRGERGLTVDVDITTDTMAAAAAPTGPVKRAAPETTPAAPTQAAPVERVNGKIVASTTAKPAPVADDGIATSADDVGLNEGGEAAPFGDKGEEASGDQPTEEGRAGKSIFGSM